jgi:1,4-dihydroxy-2-naphthoate octaprenyltransferase
MDQVSKWLIITRSCVFSITVLSAVLGAMLAALDRSFSLTRWLIVVLGLVLAHAANNMINDFFDTLEGVDTKDYPRAHYAPHPILDGLVSRNGLLAAIAICIFADFIIAIYLTTQCGWKVMAFAVAGFLTSIFYVAPPLKLKQRGLGELAIFVIWGPLMIAGTYYVMAGTIPGRIWLASVPYGLAVALALMGKHMDKLEKDKAKGVRTLPVVLGQKRAVAVTQLMVWAFYLIITALVFSRVLPWMALLVLVTLPRASRFISALHQPLPRTTQEAFSLVEDVIPEHFKKRFDPCLPLEAYPLWPLWYVVWSIWWTRAAGASFSLGLFMEIILRRLLGLPG